jgi:ElaB/YqjD/DUF883 family membrane-anchored ribosome-binding protein
MSISTEEAKKQVAKVQKTVMTEVDKRKAQAEKEIAKVRKQVDSTMKKADDLIKKNPEKAVLISAGIGAALGAVAAILMGGDSKKKKK